MSIVVRRPLVVAVALGLIAADGAAQGPAAARQESLGFNPARLGRIEETLQRYVDEGSVAGAVALVMRDGGVVYEQAVGWIDREAQRRMPADAIFRIASQSKAITSTAIMMLVEEGRVALNDPVSRWIPSFASTTVAARSDSGVSVVPARRAITIRDLLTHSAGISYGGEPQVAEQYRANDLGYGEAFGWYTADNEEPICDTMERLGTLPFVRQPGEAWVYGYNTDILGCVVERASGIPLDRFILERITEPLGMPDTYFFLPRDKRERLATVYAPDSAGRAVRAADGARGQGHYVEGPRRSFAGGAGLLSTARDYARFLEMIRRGGELDGVRILAPQTVALMTTNQVGELRGTNGVGFGLGFETVDRLGASGFSSAGAFGWSGAYGSSYEVDPSRRTVMVLMLQLVPFAGLGIRDSFETAVYQALVEP
jgi:CubicO group peptidase (beta-lactamase class C family)